VPRIRSCRSLSNLAPMTVVGWAILGGSLASACTVPVFRYALERWESDRLLVVVFHAGALTPAQDLAVAELAQRSSLVGGPLNIDVLRYDVAAPPDAKLSDVHAPADNQPLPWIRIHGASKGRQTAIRWQGPLAEAIEQPGLFDSPARGEIVRRMLKGDSAVWLLVAPEKELKGLSEQLQAKLDVATSTLTLPQGIGLPGSELYSQIPLEIRFSVLPVSHSDAKEQTFLKMVGSAAEEWRTDTAYVIPVFGRCRALEVFPYADATEALLEDVGNFLCAACSCRVKQANPGFDLLATVNWNQRLFGESIPEELREAAETNYANGSSGLPNSTPEYLTIPSGDEPAQAGEQTATTQQPERLNVATPPVETRPAEFSGPIVRTDSRPIPRWTDALLPFAVLTLVAGGLLVSVLYLRR
jgi:hypothetical protein